MIQDKLERREIKFPKSLLGYHRAIKKLGILCYQFVNYDEYNPFTHVSEMFFSLRDGFGKSTKVCYHSKAWKKRI